MRLVGIGVCWRLSYWKLGWHQSDDDYGPEGTWWFCLGPVALVFEQV